MQMQGVASDVDNMALISALTDNDRAFGILDGEFEYGVACSANAAQEAARLCGVHGRGRQHAEE